MPRIAFDDLPDTARVWVFPADRPLDGDDREELLEAVDDFLDGWNAHGTPLRGARDLRDDRFLIVGVDEDAAPPSGCSIDALVRVFKEKERELDVRLLDRSRVWYRDGDEIQCVSRKEFRRRADEGEIDTETPVFDPAVTTIEDVRDGSWNPPARESWHAQLL